MKRRDYPQVGIEPQTHTDLKVYSAVSKQAMSDIASIAIREWLDRRASQKQRIAS